MYLMASLTVEIFSASSSGISSPNPSSSAMTNSTVSKESAPRSSMNDAVGVTSDSSTPSCSTMICLTLSSTEEAILNPPVYSPLRLQTRNYRSALTAFSTDFSSSAFSIVADLSIDRMSPSSTLPGPTSTNVRTLSSYSRWTISCQRTGRDTCRFSAMRTSEAERITFASTFVTNGQHKSEMEQRSRSTDSRSSAGLNNAQ